MIQLNYTNEYTCFWIHSYSDLISLGRILMPYAVNNTMGTAILFYLEDEIGIVSNVFTA